MKITTIGERQVAGKRFHLDSTLRDYIITISELKKLKLRCLTSEPWAWLQSALAGIFWLTS